MTKIRPAQIAQASAATDDALVWDGTKWVPGPVLDPTTASATYLTKTAPPGFQRIEGYNGYCDVVVQDESGAAGVWLDCLDAGQSPLVIWGRDGVQTWNMGIDSTVGVDMALFSFDSTAGTADVMRWAPDGRVMSAAACSEPHDEHRFHILAQSTDNASLDNLLYLENGASPATEFLRCHDQTNGDVFNVDLQGRVGIGLAYQGLSVNADLEVQKGIVVHATSGLATGATLQLSQDGASNNTWVVSSEGGFFHIFDNSTSNNPIQIQKGSPSNAILIENNWVGIAFGGGATTVGFFGSTGTTRPTVTGSKGANAALGSLLTALAGLGLITDSSS